VSMTDLSDWLNEFSGPDFLWYVKRLSANDTRATDAHQAGPYIPKQLLFRVFPDLHRPSEENPRVEFDLYVDSHADHRRAHAIWYNNKRRGGSRNETRITGLGGESSALLDPESTGSLVVFAFTSQRAECHVWVCDFTIQEDMVEDRIGPVEPGKGRIWPESPAGRKPQRSSCWLDSQDLPPDWLENFPSGLEIVRRTLEFRPDTGSSPDERLMERRLCEFELFRSVEQNLELPRILNGFTDMDAFLERANSVLQRRKSRAGNSLELHTREIFLEEELRQGLHFDFKPRIDGKEPDFIFPSKAAYLDPGFPLEKLRMLAAKTTCKDRWRQILNEADRIKVKHLLTLQEGVSVNQHREMKEAGVKLVVPTQIMPKYPGEIRGDLQSLESFIADIRLLIM